MKKLLAIGLLVTSLAFGLAACDAGGTNKNGFVSPETKEEFYAYSAASVGSIIATMKEEGAASAAASLSADFAQDASGSEESGQGTASQSGGLQSVTDEQLETVNKYMALVESVLSDGNITNEVTASDREDKDLYPVKNVVRYKDLAGGEVSYTLYYNETLVRSAQDRGEKEDTYRLEGIMIIGQDTTEYAVEGVRTDESERGESENESWFRADLGGGDYIQVTQETESEKGEAEQEFRYTISRGGVVETTTLDYETEKGETELRMTVRKGDMVDVLEFEDETKGNERVIRVNATMDGERVSFRIHIKTMNGESYYRYEFSDGYRDYDRYDDQDDFDD